MDLKVEREGRSTEERLDTAPQELQASVAENICYDEVSKKKKLTFSPKEISLFPHTGQMFSTAYLHLSYTSFMAFLG